MPPESLTVILNKLHAMNTAGIITMRQVSEYCSTREQRAGEWITRRTRRPSGDFAFKLLAFAADQTVRISASPRKLQKRYREAYAEACISFPVDGREK